MPDSLQLLTSKKDLIMTSEKSKVDESDDTNTDSDSDSDSDQDRSELQPCAWKKIATNVKFHSELSGPREIFDILFEYIKNQDKFAEHLHDWTRSGGIVKELFHYAISQYKPKPTKDTIQYLKDVVIISSAKRSSAEGTLQTVVGIRSGEFVRENPTCPSGLKLWIESMSHNGTKNIQLSLSCELKLQMIQSLLKDRANTMKILNMSPKTLIDLLSAYTEMSDNCTTGGSDQEPLFFTDTSGSITETTPVATRIQQYLSDLKDAPEPKMNGYHSDASSVDSQPETKRIRAG